jgi:hypothetical protein
VIGLIGPEDSVALTLRVAAEIGLVDSVVARTYKTPDEAPRLARELDSVCRVLLFTGRLPYSLAMADAPHRAQLDCLAHSDIDIYRSLVLLLRRFEGRLPVLSIDTIEAETVAEVWRDVLLEPPTTVLPLTGDPGSAAALVKTDDVVAFHMNAWRSGSVEGCLTCLHSVYDALSNQGVPVYRVEHTRAAIQAALHRARRAAEASQMEAQQIAVGLLEHRLADETTGRVTAQGNTPAVRSAFKRLVDRLHGRAQELDGNTSMLYTTWGALQDELNRSGEQLVPEGLRFSMSLGFGLGATLPRAEENARRALAMARIDGTPAVVLTDGTVRQLNSAHPRSTIALRHTDPRILELSKAMEMSPTSVDRLSAALRTLDTQAFTANDLSESLHIQQRSARRILAKLERHGVASRIGNVAGTDAGRPRTVYKANLDKLV